MRAKRRPTSFSLVVLVGSGLHLAALADETDAVDLGAGWPAQSIPAERVYIPGQGIPPGFAPSPSRAERTTNRERAQRDAFRIRSTSWIEQRRKRHFDGFPATGAPPASLKGELGAAAPR